MRPRKATKTLAFVRAMARRGVRVASVCSGAYMLAESGLLDGRRATTHWRRTRQFLARFPKVKWEPDQIFVRDGDIWSSAGITAGIDLALAMATEDYGEEIVRQTARQLVLYHRRSGGQSQFSSLLELKAPSGRFGRAPDLGARASRRAADRGGSRRAGRHELAAFHPRVHRRDRFHAVQGRGASADRSGAAARAILRRGDRTGGAATPAFAIRNGCAAPSSAPSASRRNRCAARRGRGSRQPSGSRPP